MHIFPYRPFMTRLLFCLFCWVFCLTVVATPAAESPADETVFSGPSLYVTPEGSGGRHGGDWDNALSARDGLQTAWDQVPEGGQLCLGSGTYPKDLSLRIRRTRDHVAVPRRGLVGFDTGNGFPVFQSDFDPQNPEKTGTVFCEIAPGSGQLTIRGLRLEGYRMGVSMRGRNHDVHVIDVDVTGTRDAFFIDGGATAEAPDAGSRGLYFRGCDIKNYTKRAIRIRNGVQNSTIQDCHADGGGPAWTTERFAMGFHLYCDQEGVVNRSITFLDCSSRRNSDPKADGYRNGDGFAAEPQNHGLLWVRCEATDNTDGGWDDKSVGAVLINCVAKRNGRNFRFWTGTQPSRMIRCQGLDANREGGCGLWAGGDAHVEAIECIFAGNPIGIDLDRGEAENQSRVVVLQPLNAESQNELPHTIDAGCQLSTIDTHLAP